MKKRYAKVRATGAKIEIYRRPKTGRLIPCPGEAHSNPFIDHCGTCMPRWGKVEEEAPLDLQAAKAAGQAVSFDSDITPEIAKEIESMGGKLIEVEEKRPGCTSIFDVFVWEAAQ